MELYQDKHQSTERRVEDLLARMTLEEKAAQLCGDLAAGTLMAARLRSCVTHLIRVILESSRYEEV